MEGNYNNGIQKHIQETEIRTTDVYQYNQLKLH